MNINYRKLLKKYLRHVASEEGVTFIGDRDTPQGFTDSEWAALRALDEEAFK